MPNDFETMLTTFPPANVLDMVPTSEDLDLLACDDQQLLYLTAPYTPPN